MDSIGPQLPPHLLKKNTDNITAVPPCSSAHPKTRDESIDPERPSSSVLGPSLPPNLVVDRNDSEDSASSSGSDDCIGPALNLKGGDYDVRREFSEREKRKKAKDDEDKQKKRDSWMTELPDDRTGVKIGLGARTFTKRDGQDVKLDRGWTETPGSERKGDTEKATKDDELVRAQRKRDANIDAELAEYNAKKRTKSLMDLHKQKKKDKKEKKSKKDKKDKKSKKSKKSDTEAPERKAFNWEEDMRVSMVDTTRAKGMMDKTLLKSRFAPSKSQKYL